MKRLWNPVARMGALASWVALVLFAGGCRYVDKLLNEPEPTVDPRQVFPAFEAAGSAQSSGSSSPGPWDFPPCDGWSTPGDRLRLGEIFTAELPPGEGWARAEGGRATILVRYLPGSSTPSAFLYAERIDVAGGLGTALLRFHERVDQRLQAGVPRQPPAVTAPPSPADQVSENGGIEPPNDPGTGDPASLPGDEGPTDESSSVEEPLPRSTETMAALATVAVGYTSEEWSFTGWRWIGECAPPEKEAEEGAESVAVEPDTAIKPFLRLSRSRGIWRLQPGAQPVPAFLILGTVTLPDRRNYGVHLAIVCTETFQGQDAPALARLLGSIRVAPGAGGPPAGAGWGSDALRELAEEVGISVP